MKLCHKFGQKMASNRKEGKRLYDKRVLEKKKKKKKNKNNTSEFETLLAQGKNKNRNLEPCAQNRKIRPFT